MSLTIKAFLQRDGKWDSEIRRFQVPADVSSSFTYLSKKLCDIFPSLTSSNFSVFWKDSEGDHVSFSTDEELMEALGYVTDGIFKIYLILNADGGQKESEVVHPGVVCDGCESSICGPRFKCMTCPDYDLCKVCEGQGVHVEHDMMKIMVPGTFAGFAGFPGFPGFPGFGGQQGAAGPHGPGPHGQFAPPPHFRRWMQKFMKRWHNRNAPGWKEGEKCEKEEEKMEQDAEKEQDTGDKSGEEFLRSVGETVSAMLDPFGIDVDVSVDTHKEDEADQKDQTEQENKRQGQGRCQGRRGRPGRGRCGNRGRQGFGYGGPFDMYGFMSGCPMGQGQWECGPRGKGNCNGDDEKCKKSKCTGKGNAEKRNEKEGPAQTVSPPQKVPESQDKMEVENQKPKGRDKDAWTLLNMNSVPSSGATNIPDSQPQPLIPEPAPTAPPQQSQGPLYPPADPKIAEALQQMTAMGFTNEGGWLTNLLEAKGGDIVQVLDAIRPQRARTNADGTMA